MSTEPRDPLIASLRERIDEALGPHLPTDRPVALVDYPNHPNTGDSAIWMGEVAYLRSRGVRVAYTCDFASYSEQRLRERVGDGTILLHGGGSVGDVWQETQLFRERVIASFPGNKVVQLPQTIHFEARQNVERARSVFDAHPDLTLLVRDQTSLKIAQEEFRTASVACPDMAFALGRLERTGSPSCDVLWLSRTDVEARHSAEGQLPPGVQRADWLEQHGSEAPWRVLRGATKVAARRIANHPALARPLSGPLSRLQGPMAGQRVRAGAELLGSGRAVITDRLHGHILSLLLGIPHVLLDNTYGKLRSFYEAWTSGSQLARWAESPEEALVLAQDLARDLPPR